jgi:hypothetical protein
MIRGYRLETIKHVYDKFPFFFSGIGALVEIYRDSGEKT